MLNKILKVDKLQILTETTNVKRTLLFSSNKILNFTQMLFILRMKIVLMDYLFIKQKMCLDLEQFETIKFLNTF